MFECGTGRLMDLPGNVARLRPESSREATGDMDASSALTEMIEGRLKPGVYQWSAPAVPGAEAAGTGWTERAEDAAWSCTRRGRCSPRRIRARFVRLSVFSPRR
jgi:hypothetical protein